MPIAAVPRSLRVFALVAALCAIAACARVRTHDPDAQHKPVSAQPAVKSSRSAIAQPVTVLDPRAEEQDKNRIKLALAKSSHDALTPAQVGYYMDVLHGRLKQVAGVAVDRHDERIILNLSLRFKTGGAKLDAGMHEILTQLSNVLVEYHMTMVSVHMDAGAVDDPSASPALMGQRAQALAHYLTKAGVAGKRIVIAGSASRRSLPGDAGEDRAHVQLQIEPIVSASAPAR
jgi:outer membrane protein OmpA-like peptidoglycan-associated protein